MYFVRLAVAGGFIPRCCTGRDADKVFDEQVVGTDDYRISRL